MKIYIACGLTHIPRRKFQSYVKRLHQLAQELSEIGDIKYALIHSDPQLALLNEEDKAQACYSWDRKMVESADLIIAEASYPSTGLGIELQIAESKKIPIILCYRRSKSNKAEPIEYTNPDKEKHYLQIGSGYISLMALGLPNVAKVISYWENPELNEKIRVFIQEMK